MVKLRDKIIKIPAKKLAEYSRNNKVHPEAQISLLIENIERFGFTQPLLVDKDNVIIAGHGRFEAANRLNMKELPCIVMDDLSDIEIKALRIADNRIAEMGETDLLNLKEEFLELAEDDSSLEFLTGYDSKDLNLFQDEIIKQPPVLDEGGSSTRLKHLAICPKCDHEFKLKVDK